MKVAVILLAIQLMLATPGFTQTCPVNTKIAFISILGSGSLDPRTNNATPTKASPGHIGFAFVYPDTCIMHNRSLFRRQKDALRDLTLSYIGVDSLRGYVSFDYAFFDRITGLHPLEMWREYLSPAYKDTFNTPQKRLDLLRTVMPFLSIGAVTDTSIEVVLKEIPGFSPQFKSTSTSTGYTFNGYVHILSSVIHFYVLNGMTMVTNITYIKQNGEVEISRFDMKVPYDFMLQNALAHPN